MTRPCTCDRCPPDPFTPFIPGKHCRLCWLYHHAPEYRAFWDATPPRTAPCRHRGEQIDSIRCATCHGRVHLKVFACAVFGSCTAETAIPTHACCRDCLSYESR